MSSVTYGLYLSTNTSTNSLKPVNKTNLNNVKWSINWREIFGNREGECRVRVKVTSASATNLTWSANVGSVRASFASNYQNSTNGFNLGAVLPQLDTTATTTTTVPGYTSTSTTNIGVSPPVTTYTIPSYQTTTTNITSYLDCDTRATAGVSMIIPKTNTDFTLSFYNANETAMANVPEYQVWLYFDVKV
jgi:hypothetical protein